MSSGIESLSVISFPSESQSSVIWARLVKIFPYSAVPLTLHCIWTDLLLNVFVVLSNAFNKFSVFAPVYCKYVDFTVLPSLDTSHLYCLLISLFSTNSNSGGK